MKLRHLPLGVLFVLFPILAHAESQDGAKTPATIESLLWALLPFLVLGFVIWLFFVRLPRKGQAKADEYLSRQMEHDARVEQLLERIARALEKNDGEDH